MDWCFPTGSWGCFLSLWWVGLCLLVILEMAVCMGTSLGSLFPDGWDCDPTWIIVLPRGLSSDARGHIFPKWPPQEKFELMNIPKSLASKVFPPQ